MKTVLRILMIEDSEDDALLTLHQIKKGGYDAEYERIETADEMKILLREKPWDIILSDYKMPHFNGMEALSLFKESGLDIPFIIISGTIGEDIAVEAMRSGAQDYIMKNNVNRLLPAIERELRESVNRREKKRLEQIQKQAESYLHLLGTALEAAANCIVITDKEGTILWVNPAFTDLTAYTAQEVIGQNPRILKSGKQDPVFYANLWQTILSGNMWRNEIINRRKDGTFYTEEATITPVQNQDGEITHFIAVKQDITERKRAQQNIALLSFALNNVHEAAFLIDERGYFSFVNQESCRILGYTHDELLAMCLMDVDPDFPAEQWQSYWSTLKMQRSMTFEGHHRPKDGRVFPVEINANYIEYSGKAYILALVRDITIRKRLEEQLHHQQADMAHMLRLSEIGEMASGLAHEINQPLCAIENYAQACLRLMKTQPDTARLADAIKDIRDQAERAGKIIHRIKGLVRKKPPHFEYVELKDIVQETMDLISMEAKKRGIRILVNIPDVFPPVYVDAILIEQVLLNLVRNGLEAMDGPQINKKELTIQALLRSNDRVEMNISDTGCGIPEENMKKIFESFFTTKPDGLGIGLPLSKAIIESHNGRIWAAANAEVGTTFQFTLPIRKPDNET